MGTKCLNLDWGTIEMQMLLFCLSCLRLATIMQFYVTRFLSLSADEVMGDKKALVVSGLKIVLNEQSLRVSLNLSSSTFFMLCTCIATSIVVF